tara:strand:+ start:1083 stop:1214 length:132 start_codon:yes stop_codon:yes gene_type:complete
MALYCFINGVSFGVLVIFGIVLLSSKVKIINAEMESRKAVLII